jgi:hypothetical protein
LPKSNGQQSNASHNELNFRCTQQIFDEARSKCHGYGTLTTNPIFDDPSTANTDPEASRPPAVVPTTTSEESDEDDSGSEAHLHSEDKFEENNHWCGTCGVLFREDQIERHLISKKHRKNEKRIPQPSTNPATPVSNPVQWRRPVPVFTAVAVLLIACYLATPVVVSLHFDGEFLLEPPQAQARLAERLTRKSQFGVLETPAGGTSTIEIRRAYADTQDFGLLQSSP